MPNWTADHAGSFSRESAAEIKETLASPTRSLIAPIGHVQSARSDGGAEGGTCRVAKSPATA